MVAVPITPGMTEWAVAQQYGVSVSAIEAANSVSPTSLQVGQVLIVPTGGSFAPASSGTSSSGSSSAGDHEPDGDSDDPVSHTAPVQQSSPSSVAPAYHSSSSSSSSSSGSGGGFQIPGASSALSSCIAFRESTNGTNPAAGGNVFGIIPASGYNVSGMSLSQQEQVAGQIMATTGPSAWAADGCPGT